MTARGVLGLAAFLLAGATSAAGADGPMPAAFRSLRPYQVVEQLMAQRELLSLSDEQFARLDDLSIAIRMEHHRFAHKGGKRHATRHVPMITRRQAYAQAIAILTPEQQARIGWLYPSHAPVQPATRKPSPRSGKP